MAYKYANRSSCFTFISFHLGCTDGFTSCYSLTLGDIFKKFYIVSVARIDILTIFGRLIYSTQTTLVLTCGVFTDCICIVYCDDAFVMVVQCESKQLPPRFSGNIFFND